MEQGSFGVFLIDLLRYILPFLTAVFILGFAGLPTASKILRNLGVKSLFFSIYLSLFIISSFIFTVGTFTGLPLLRKEFILLILLIWGCINLFLVREKINKENLINIYSKYFTTLLPELIIFIFLFFSMYFLLARRPEIYQIERFMDFGFIKTIESTKQLPLPDLWFANNTTNYYYFSHLAGYVLLTISSVNILQGFYLLTCLLFAVTGILIYLVTKEILRSNNFNGFWQISGGLFSVFLFNFSGPLHSIKWFISSVTDGKFFEPAQNFWYAEATRSIAGTITEVPFFSYLEANIHPHVYGYLVLAMFLVILWDLYTDSNTSIETSKYLVISFLYGVALITNTWDVIPLATITSVIVISKYKLNFFKDYKAVVTSIALLLITILPLVTHLRSPLKGIGIVHSPSPISDWIFFWGNLAIPTFISIIFVRKFLDIKNKFVYFLIIQVLILFVFSEIFYFKDILLEGEWYRANTFLKLTGHEWILLSIVCVVLLFKLLQKFKTAIILIPIIIFIGSIYPYKTIQYFRESRQYTGLKNPLNWLSQKYPGDYQALNYLEAQKKPFKILEASGESYDDNNYFSVFLGAPSIVGWPVHEWTWRGDYTEVGNRRTEVSEIYTGIDLDRSKSILEKYKIDYIILGAQENRIYGSRLQLGAIETLGTQVYENQGTRVFKVNN